ncbi:alpha-amylase, partial [Candidatus Bathyarchaeota archaeon]|nr:alpha-amylase [Candidatus Bathyarchaeota archaeon]
HHWPESGIYEFLRWLPGEVIKWSHLDWHTPSEVIQRHAPVGEIDVQDLNTVSWADLERDPSAWIDNPMQILSFESLKRLEQPVKATGDKDLIKLWRQLQMSDHLYYMSIKGGGPGDVHNYFNPSGNPIEAFAVFSRVLSDLESRVQLELEKPELAAKRILRQIPVGKGFTFFYKLGQPTDWTVHSLDDFYSALKDVAFKSIRFHLKRGDFERWLRQVVGDDKLADELVDVSKKKIKGRKLRKSVLDLVKARIKELKEMSI